MESVIGILEGIGVYVLFAIVIYVLLYFFAIKRAKTLTEMGIDERCGDCDKTSCVGCDVLREEVKEGEKDG